jgi:hypothetical protein
MIPGTDWDDRLSLEIFVDKPVEIFRIVPFVHNITIRLLENVTLRE